jgi:hypothetical protein
MRRSRSLHRTRLRRTGRLKTVATLASAILGSIASPAFADWHYGTVTGLSVAYDGSTVVVIVSGWTRTNCTCYSTWPTAACLDRSRTSFHEEYALLLSARRVGQPVGINIDEATCKVLAIDDSQ